MSPWKIQQCFRAESCINCPRGFAQSSELGTSFCETCGRGSLTGRLFVVRRVQTGKDQIFAIDARRAARARRAPSCTSCPIGFFQDKIGQQECFECYPGQYSDIAANIKCKDCPKDTYASAPETLSARHVHQDEVRKLGNLYASSARKGLTLPPE